MSKQSPFEIREIINKKVLDHDYGKPLLLLAGPGTGKTYKLLETIKKQIEQGLKPSDFYEATLTNAAADDFKKDVKSQIPEFESSSTLHKRAKGILHNNAGLLKLRADFTVVDEKCEKLILQDICYILKTSFREILREQKNYRECSAKYIGINTKFSQLYNKLQTFYSAIDWLDVVKLACHLLEEHREVREVESNKFKFLLIDEYQDLNPADQKFVELLLNGRSQLLVAGDDDQSIYSGRYAYPEGIVNFAERYKNARKLVLPVSSRLPTRVINASQSLISKNKTRENKRELIALEASDLRANSGFVISVNLKSDKAERGFIYQALEELLKKQILPNQILVLCNCRHLGKELIQVVKEYNGQIPIENELEKTQVLDEDLLLLDQMESFLSDQENNLSLRIVLSKIIGCKDASFLVEKSIHNKASLWGVLNLKEIINLLVDSKKQISDFVEIVYRAIKIENREDRIVLFLTKFDPLKYLLKLLEEKEKKKDEKEIPEISKGIRFMTLHTSKGLDADFIFIPFMEESIGLPASDLEEKRRLLYVALARAKVGVIISWAWSRRSDKRFKCSGPGGKPIGRQPSALISECAINPFLRSPKAKPASSVVAMSLLSKYAEHVHEFDQKVG